jgi:thiamine monophosphate kinase
VLHGGEEFALLFTTTMRESELSGRVGRPVYAIGRIVEQRGVRIDGEPLAAGGFDHFA